MSAAAPVVVTWLTPCKRWSKCADASICATVPPRQGTVCCLVIHWCWGLGCCTDADCARISETVYGPFILISNLQNIFYPSILLMLKSGLMYRGKVYMNIWTRILCAVYLKLKSFNIWTISLWPWEGDLFRFYSNRTVKHKQNNYNKMFIF